MEHTKQPWNVALECEWTVDHDRYSSYSWVGIEASGETVALAVTRLSDDLLEANARRIVTCVNACAGIPTEELEKSGSIACEVQDEAQAELLKAWAQRDDLAKTSVALADYLHSTLVPGFDIPDDVYVPWRDAIRNAIEGK